MPEKILIKRVQKGDTKSMEKLFEKHFKTLFVFIRHKVNSKEDAEDVTAESFRKAFEKIPLFKFKSSFKTWLYTISKNLIYDYYKKNYKKLETTDNFLDVLYQQNVSIVVKRENSDYKELQVALKKLKKKYADVIECRFFLNMSTKETATALEISSGNVKVIQNRAIKKLKELLKESKNGEK